MAKSTNDCHSIQGLIVINCETNSDNTIIKKILNRFYDKSDESEEYEPKVLDFGSNESIDCYELNINNKYYSANICLFDVHNKRLINKRFADCVNGVIIYFDSNQDSSFDCVESWLPFINEYNNEIKLLICRTLCANTSNKRQTLEKWCLDNEFELVELCPQTDDQDLDEEDSDDDFKDIDGMVRITQAIQAYSWPYSTLKDRPQYNPSPKFKDLIDKEVFDSINDNPFNDINSLNKVTIFDEKESEFESFDELFTQFSEMKVKASQMSETDRRRYAEKVTIAFWRAIDGDQQEIDGLDTSDET